MVLFPSKPHKQYRTTDYYIYRFFTEKFTEILHYRLSFNILTGFFFIIFNASLYLSNLFLAPWYCITDSAFAKASCTAKSILPFFIMPARNEEAKASPEPVVSTTFILCGLAEYTILLF